MRPLGSSRECSLLLRGLTGMGGERLRGFAGMGGEQLRGLRQMALHSAAPESFAVRRADTWRESPEQESCSTAQESLAGAGGEATRAAGDSAAAAAGPLLSAISLNVMSSCRLPRDSAAANDAQPMLCRNHPFVSPAHLGPSSFKPHTAHSVPSSLRLHAGHSVPSSFKAHFNAAHFSTVASAAAPSVSPGAPPAHTTQDQPPTETPAPAPVPIPAVEALDALFRVARPAPLGTGPNPRVVVEPAPGLSGMILKGLGFYGKESRLIRGARALYTQVQRRADDEGFLAAFGLEDGFRATHALRVLHLWLCLVRLRAEAATEDAAEVGQTMYDLFNHDSEKRVVAAGVTVLVTKWMKELEKNFYGACLSYDNALKPEAAKDALEAALWRNVLADGERFTDDRAVVSAAASRALARYVRLQLASLSMTGSDAFLTGNVRFTELPENGK